MNEQQNNGLSVSFRIDDGIIEHNNRSFIAKNVVRERIPDNITIAELHNDLLKGFLLLSFSDMFVVVGNDPVTPFHSGIVFGESFSEQLGIKFTDILLFVGYDCSVGSENGELAKQMLDEYMRGFEARNPNLKVFKKAICSTFLIMQ